jgi:hypothetical protein
MAKMDPTLPSADFDFPASEFLRTDPVFFSDCCFLKEPCFWTSFGIFPGDLRHTGYLT